MNIRQIIAASAIALAAMGVNAASAKVWDFSFSSTLANGAGQFVTGDAGSPYTVTGISGLVDGSNITGLSSYAGASQLLFTSTPNFDVGGISFGAVNGISYNLTDYPDGTDRITTSAVDAGGVGTPTPVALTSFSVSAVPEPATWALFFLGFGAIGWTMRGERRKGTVAVA